MEDILYLPYAFEVADGQEVMDLMGHLVPENMFVFFHSKQN